MLHAVQILLAPGKRRFAPGGNSLRHICASWALQRMRRSGQSADRYGLLRMMPSIARQRNESIREQKDLLELVTKSEAAIARHVSGNEKLKQTRSEVVFAWRAVAQLYQAEGNRKVADEVRSFVECMAPPATDQQHLAAKTRNRTRTATLGPRARTR